MWVKHQKTCRYCHFSGGMKFSLSRQICSKHCHHHNKAKILSHLIIQQNSLKKGTDAKDTYRLQTRRNLKQQLPQNTLAILSWTKLFLKFDLTQISNVFSQQKQCWEIRVISFLKDNRVEKYGRRNSTPNTLKLFCVIRRIYEVMQQTAYVD